MVAIVANTADEYLAQLPPERRAVVSAVRDVIRRNLPAGYVEEPGFGMITYTIPLARYPKTYNGKPLCYVALAAQKNHYALYVMEAYQNAESAASLEAAFERIGKPLDMGKSCIRFQRLEDLPLDAIGRFVAARSVDSFIARHEAARAGARPRPVKSGAAGKAAPKKIPAKQARSKKGTAQKAAAKKRR